jgi:hypothetical protein
MPTRHLAGARAVKVLAVALAICAFGSASRPGAQGFESDVNTIQTDLRDAYEREFFIYHNDLFPGFRVPSDHKIVRSNWNWNSELTSMKLSNSSAQLPITMLLALTAAAGVWGAVSVFASSSESRKPGWAF